MYKVASDRRQEALHRGKSWDWANGVEHQSDEDRFQNVKRSIKSIEAQILALPIGPERTRLGLQKLALQNEAKELRAKVCANNIASRGIADFFITIAREQLLPAQFKAMWAAAKRLQQQEHQRAADMLSAANTEKVDA